MSDPLTEQVAYYGARAPEYDQWMQRQGRYDRGAEANARWFAAWNEAREAAGHVEGRRVLEVGCGTGLTTELLVRDGRELVAIDASPEMLEQTRSRLGGTPGLDLQAADVYTWQPDRRFDAVVFSFVLSHVPSTHFEVFWERIARLLEPGGSVFLIDSLFSTASAAVDHELEGISEETVTRRLNDGREFQIVKVFHEADALTTRLAEIGWSADLRETHDLLYFGTCSLSAS